MNNKTSWEGASQWYGEIVGDGGHYYQQHVIFPKLLAMLNLKKGDSLLDLGCGDGVLSRQILSGIEYVGVDLSPSLIKKAQGAKREKGHSFLCKDATAPLEISKQSFSHGVLLLSLQNMAKPELAIENMAIHLKEGALLVLVLNHPCFRIPRQSHWGVDLQKKLQYRRIDRYLTPLEIPIQMNPGGQAQVETVSFHHPLSAYSRWLCDAGFSISLIDEWISNKVSTGKNGRMENRAREEFPLFLAISAKKN